VGRRSSRCSDRSKLVLGGLAGHGCKAGRANKNYDYKYISPAGGEFSSLATARCCAATARRLRSVASSAACQSSQPRWDEQQRIAEEPTAEAATQASANRGWAREFTRMQLGARSFQVTTPSAGPIGLMQLPPPPRLLTAVGDAGAAMWQQPSNARWSDEDSPSAQGEEEDSEDDAEETAADEGAAHHAMQIGQMYGAFSAAATQASAPPAQDDEVGGAGGDGGGGGSSHGGGRPKREQTWWTEDEDELLRSLVATTTDSKGRPMWTTIVKRMPGRSAQEARCRWQRILYNNIT